LARTLLYAAYTTAFDPGYIMSEFGVWKQVSRHRGSEE
jgi:hypothetical protein